jgi:hypothetical protein
MRDTPRGPQPLPEGYVEVDVEIPFTDAEERVIRSFAAHCGLSWDEAVSLVVSAGLESVEDPADLLEDTADGLDGVDGDTA